MPRSIDGNHFQTVWQAIVHTSNRIQEGFSTFHTSAQTINIEMDHLSKALDTAKIQWQGDILNL